MAECKDGKNLGSITSLASAGNSISELLIMQDSKCPLYLKPALVRFFITGSQKTPKKVLKNEGKGIDFIQMGARITRLTVAMFVRLSLERKDSVMSCYS